MRAKFILPAIFLLALAAIGLSNKPASHTLEYEHAWKTAEHSLPTLQSGDLIFRHGRGFISDALMSFSRHEHKYSHAGIVVVEDGIPCVIHAIGGEENKSNKLKKDLLSVFCNPASAHSFGIYRLDASPEEKNKICSAAENYYKDGLEFDTDFDLNTDNRMYCTEFVWKILNNTIASANCLPSASFSGIKYVSCDDIYLQPFCKNIFSFDFDNPL